MAVTNAPPPTRKKTAKKQKSFIFTGGGIHPHGAPMFKKTQQEFLLGYGR